MPIFSYNSREVMFPMQPVSNRMLARYPSSCPFAIRRPGFGLLKGSLRSVWMYGVASIASTFRDLLVSYCADSCGGFAKCPFWRQRKQLVTFCSNSLLQLAIFDFHWHWLTCLRLGDSLRTSKFRGGPAEAAIPHFD